MSLLSVFICNAFILVFTHAHPTFTRTYLIMPHSHTTNSNVRISLMQHYYCNVINIVISNSRIINKLLIHFKVY